MDTASREKETEEVEVRDSTNQRNREKENEDGEMIRNSKNSNVANVTKRENHRQSYLTTSQEQMDIVNECMLK